MISTGRLRLRPWAEADRPAYRAMMGDPGITRFLGPIAGPGADAAFDRHRGYRASHGLGFWAVERQDDGELIGQCGLKPGAENTPIAGAVEIGWAFRSAVWGQGFATEAAHATLDWGWRERSADAIVAIVAAVNDKSRDVALRLGMRHDPGIDFDHPLVPPGSPLVRHQVFRIARPE